jgi:hypothetical protein
VQFWSFTDAGGAGSWNERAAKTPPYAPEYLVPDTVDDSKHMLAIVESVEDHETLTLTSPYSPDRWRRSRAKDAKSAQLAEARSLISIGPAQVLAGLERSPDAEIRWDAAKDRALADRICQRALELLEAVGE